MGEGGELLAAVSLRRQECLKFSVQRRVGSDRDEQVIRTNAGERRGHGNSYR